VGNFKRPQAVSTREVGKPVLAWVSKKGIGPNKLKASPKNLHMSRARRAKIEVSRFMAKLSRRANRS